MPGYSFTATLQKTDLPLMPYVVIVPASIMEQLPDKSRIRVKGTMNKAPFSLGIQYMKDGSRYFAVSATLRKAAKIEAGSKVQVEFKLIDETVVELPEEFEAALAQDEEANELFNTLTPGYRRSLMHYVTQAKSVDVRIKRSLELLQKIKTRQLYSQKEK